MKKKLFKTIGLATLSTLSVGGSALALGYTTQYNHSINKTGNVAESNQARNEGTSLLTNESMSLQDYGIRIFYNPSVSQFEIDTSIDYPYQIEVYDATDQLKLTPEIVVGDNVKLYQVINQERQLVDEIRIDNLVAELEDFDMQIIFDQRVGFNVVNTSDEYSYKILDNNGNVKVGALIGPDDSIVIYQTVQDAVGNPNLVEVYRIDNPKLFGIVIPIFEDGNIVNGQFFNYNEGSEVITSGGYTLAKHYHITPIDPVHTVMPAVFQDVIVMGDIRDLANVWDRTQEQLTSSHSSLHSSWSTWNYHTVTNHFTTNPHTARTVEKMEGLVFSANVENVGEYPVTHLELQLNNVEYTITHADGSPDTHGTLGSSHNVLSHVKTDFLNVLGSIFAPLTGFVGDGLKFLAGSVVGLVTFTAGSPTTNFADHMSFYTHLQDSYGGVVDPSGIMARDFMTGLVEMVGTMGMSEMAAFDRMLNEIASIPGVGTATSFYVWLGTGEAGSQSIIGTQRMVDNLMTLTGGRYSKDLVNALVKIATFIPNFSFSSLLAWINSPRDQQLMALGTQNIQVMNSQIIDNLKRIDADALDLVNSDQPVAVVKFPTTDGQTITLQPGDTITFTGDTAVRYGANHSGWSILEASGYQSAIDVNEEILLLQYIQQWGDEVFILSDQQPEQQHQ